MADAAIDGGDDAVADAGPDTSGGGSGPTCATSVCAAGEVCCVDSTQTPDGGFAATMTCLTTCPAPAGGSQLGRFACTSTSDCVTNVCCIERVNNVDVSSCETSCTGNQVELCDPQAVDAGCPPSEPCSTNNISDWNLPPAFATCGGRSVP